MREAGFGSANEARRIADAALKLLPGSQAVEAETALAFSMAGETARANALAQDLNRRFPLDTQVQTLWLPTIQAKLALNAGDPASAFNYLHATGSMDLAAIQFLADVSCLYPAYVRGEAYLAEGNGVAAAGEFHKIVDHAGITWNCWTGALAHLGLARAYAIEAGSGHLMTKVGVMKAKPATTTTSPVTDPAALAKARAAYQDFFALWKDADSDIPILKDARAEFAKLP